MKASVLIVGCSIDRCFEFVFCSGLENSVLSLEINNCELHEFSPLRFPLSSSLLSELSEPFDIATGAA